MIDPDVGYLMCGGCALLFASASWHKWWSPQDFAAVLASYQIVPATSVGLFRWLIPLLELAIALALIAAPFRGAAALAGVAARWSERPLGAVDALTISGGIAIAALLYAAIDRLLGEVMPRAQLLRGRG